MTLSGITTEFDSTSQRELEDLQYINLQYNMSSKIQMLKI